MKKYFYSIAVAILALAACTKEYENTYIISQEEFDKNVVTKDEITVSMPEQTKTFLSGENGKVVYWEPGDQISVWSSFDKTPITYSISGVPNGTDIVPITDTGAATVNFAVEEGKGVKYLANDPTTKFYAIYPANDNKTVTVSANQAWKGFKNFAKGVNPMIVSGDKLDNLTFKSPCGIMEFNLATDGLEVAHLGYIEITAKNSSLGGICGTAEVDWNTTPATLKWTTLSKTVTLQGGDAVISTDKTKPSTYYIVVAPGTYTNLEIEVSYVSDDYRTLKKNRKIITTAGQTPINIEAGKIFRFPKPFELTTKDPKEPEKYEVGDLYPKGDGATPVGVVFQVAADGLSGKVVALKDKGATATVTTGTLYQWGTYPGTNRSGAASEYNGLSNTTAISGTIKSSEITCPPVEACTELTDGGLNWYLPASRELQTVKDSESLLKENSEYTALKTVNSNYWTSTVVTDDEDPEDVFTYVIYYYAYRNRTTLTYYFEQKLAEIPIQANTTTKIENGAYVRAIAQFESK